MKDKIARDKIDELINKMENVFGLSAIYQGWPISTLQYPAVNVRREIAKLNERLDRLFSYLKIEEIKICQQERVEIRPKDAPAQEKAVGVVEQNT